jgi:hypothetical protein
MSATSFKDYQRAFSDYCRTGDFTTLPVYSEERAKVYHSLISNGIEDALSRAYPLTIKVLGQAEWSALVKKFQATEALPSPQLWKMPYSLIPYAEREGLSRKFNRPYLSDLLLFEWIEIEVQMMPDLLPTYLAPTEQNQIWINPEHQLLKFSYPVFRTIEEPEVLANGEYSVLCYREPESGEVHFVELSQTLANLIERLEESPQNISTLIETFPDSERPSCISFLDYGVSKGIFFLNL